MSNSKTKITSGPSHPATSRREESKKIDAAAKQSKTGLLVDLLSRDEGATTEEIVAATSWLPHTTRAALTGLKKKGHVIASDKVEGVRRYRIVGAAA